MSSIDAYVIDCVPERSDLGSLQMITSTTKTDEVRALLDEMLGAMSLSSSRRNCEFLVNQLKALSGRMAMRLTSAGNRSSELIALALLQASCAATSAGGAEWLSLQTGFFVPLDDVPDLAPAERNNGPSKATWNSRLPQGSPVAPRQEARSHNRHSNPAHAPIALDSPLTDALPVAERQGYLEHENTGRTSNEQPAPAVRSDLIYVSLPARGGLSFVFVEVKYRRHLRVAREPQLIEQIAGQAESHRQQWLDYYFDSGVPEIVAAVRRSRLVRALQFYLEKARRHSLDGAAYPKLSDQLDRLIRDGADYRLSEPEQPTRGYVFCPEMSRADPEFISQTSGGTRVMLFGPARLPDLIAGYEMPVNGDDDSTRSVIHRAKSTGQSLIPSAEDVTPTAPSDDELAGSRDASDATTDRVAVAEETLEGNIENVSHSQHETGSSPTTQAARIILGTDAFSETDVEWQVTSKANPHLMVVGLPGMGKTEALLNICQ